MSKSRINALSLPSDLQASGLSQTQQEQYAALKDLLSYSHFQPHNDNSGPYDLSLSVEENRLVIRMRNAAEQDLSMLVLSLSPYRRLIQDYFLMMQSYEKARQDQIGFEKLEALDMGRRGLHNEGADLVIARLKNHVEMDHETARRFFSLICLLTHRSTSLL